MSQVDYSDFTVHIAPEGEFGFRSRVVDSPRGRGDAPFSPPLDLSKMQSRMRRIDGVLRGLEGAGPHALRDLVPDRRSDRVTTEELAQEVGEALWEALFTGRVGELFGECLALHEDDPTRGLRLRIVLDPDKRGFAGLTALPWELIRRSRPGKFLSRDARTPVILEINGQNGRRQERRGALRVLLVQSKPGDVTFLDVDGETRSIREALALVDEVEVVTIPAKLAALRKILQKEVFHVVHFMGHGAFDRAKKRASLVFESEHERTRYVSGEVLADYLQVPQRPELVFLNACHSGRLPRREGGDPFSGVGTALARRGHLAVVAMQFSISDLAAGRFSRAFYQALAAGNGVDASVGEARLALLDLGEESLEWATPVLFMSSIDGLIFVRPDEAEASPEAREVPRIGVRTFLQEQDPMEETTDKGRLLSLVRHFDGRKIRRPRGDEGSPWQDPVLRELRGFVGEQFYREEEARLQLDTHASVACAAGWLLGAKSHQKIAIRQRVPQRGLVQWPLEEKTDQGDLWLDPVFHEVPGKGTGLAVALSVSWPVLTDVKRYVEREMPDKIGRILDLTIAPEPGPHSVRSGGHAVRLASQLGTLLKERTDAEARGPIHLFVSAPNAFLFALGRQARGFGKVQLYEYYFEEGIPRGYEPSILLDPTTLGTTGPVGRD